MPDPEHAKAKDRPLLETLTIVNMVAHYREQLTVMGAGSYAPDLFSNLERSRLSELGIIEIRRDLGIGSYTVPWEVEVLMERLK